MVLYSWIKEIINFVLDLKMGIFQIELGLSDLSGLITVLVIFVFAELYRAGIEMKEESEFII